MDLTILLIFILCLFACAAALFVALVWFLAAKYVNSKAIWPGDVEQPAGRRPHLHPVNEDRGTVSVKVFAPRSYVDRLARHYEDWAEAFVKANLVAAVNEATAEVVESADGNGNLAHVRDAHGRCPDLLIRLPKGASLVKVGAGKFDVVVSPVAANRPNGPKSPDAGHDGTGSGNDGGENPDNLK